MMHFSPTTHLAHVVCRALQQQQGSLARGLHRCWISQRQCSASSAWACSIAEGLLAAAQCTSASPLGTARRPRALHHTRCQPPTARLPRRPSRRTLCNLHGVQARRQGFLPAAACLGPRCPCRQRKGRQSSLRPQMALPQQSLETAELQKTCPVSHTSSCKFFSDVHVLGFTSHDTS